MIGLVPGGIAEIKVVLRDAANQVLSGRLLTLAGESNVVLFEESGHIVVQAQATGTAHAGGRARRRIRPDRRDRGPGRAGCGRRQRGKRVWALRTRAPHGVGAPTPGALWVTAWRPRPVSPAVDGPRFGSRGDTRSLRSPSATATPAHSPATAPPTAGVTTRPARSASSDWPRLRLPWP